MDLETLKAVWDKLQETFEGTDRGKAVRLLTLKREFELLRMKDDVKYYSARMMDVVNQTRLHGEVVKDQKVAEKMIKSVPQSFYSKISQHLWKRKFQHRNNSDSTSQNSSSTSKKFGHLEKYCRAKKAHNNTQGIHQANVSEEDQVDNEHLFIASHLDKHPNSLTWLMDSGCTSRMTPERSFFISLDTKDNLRVKLGDRRYTRAKGRCTIAINTKKAIMLDVANASAFSVNEDDSMKWHNIFGHFNYSLFKHMNTTKLVRDMPPISEVNIPEFDIEDTNDTDVLRTRPLVDVYESCNLILEPESYMEASKHSEWIDAMKAELEMIKKNNTWKLVDLPKGKNAIVLLAIAAQRNWKSHHLDVKFVFLNGELEEEIYVKQPEVFEEEFKFGTTILFFGMKTKQLLNEVHISQRKYANDNKSLIAIAENPVQHGRTKYINVKYHAIREAERNREVKLKYCTSETQLADMLTKSINGKKLNYFKARLIRSNNNLKEC
ncbi:retrovirus-related pol polyprotein from transposon TNT 1-94 [Tanacetum coccineum]|uniref:Retrovirus-related pol polyprotein from transposon TNT 1-94 n=1 Tax=Tanacetum coccineum TaxID=301880 RepID=A0ABQ4YE71_9ASTR